MNRVVRRIVEMAGRVLGFSRAHPSAEASYASVIGRLEELVARIRALAVQQQDGYRASRSATARRRAVRERVHHEMLRHLVTVAQAAAAEAPALTQRFRLPPTNATTATFATIARGMLQEALASREVLLKHGLSGSLLDELAAALDEFDALVTASAEARLVHVGASAELERVCAEVLDVVELLDGLNRYRFGREGELAAAWASAKRVTPSGRGAEPPAETQGGAEEARPAA
jgi:hypothetical protein